MKSLLAFTGIFFCLQAPAQENSDRDSAVYYRHQGQNARALPFAKRHFEAVQNISNKDSVYISAANYLAGIYASLGNYDSAMVCYLKVCEEVKSNMATPVRYIARTFNAGRSRDIWRLLEEAGQTYQNLKVFLDNPDSAYRKTALYKSAYTRYLNGYALFMYQLEN